jgi:MFS family permease
MGFYGPPVFLSVLHKTRGWPLALISTAVTVHFLTGAVIGANLPALYRRFCAPTVTKTGALCLVAGVLGWSTAAAPWQLLVAGALGGAGWGAMSAAAINSIVSPWFVRARPAALGMAHNGGSNGGVIFSPLWVAAIGVLGFSNAAAAIGLVMALSMWLLADLFFSRTPQQMGLLPDGDIPRTSAISVTLRAVKPLPGRLLWRECKFLTLAAGMAFGLFAQIGLTAHLFSLVTPALGAQQAGLAMGSVTAMAIVGSSLLGWAMPLRADRRVIACIAYTAQLAGSVAFIGAAGTSLPMCFLASSCSAPASVTPRHCRRSLLRSNSSKTTSPVRWPSLSALRKLPMHSRLPRLA